MTILKGKYIGTIKLLYGKTALVKRTKNKGIIKVQFDDMSLPRSYTHGWCDFFESAFELYEIGLDEPSKGELEELEHLSITEARLLEADPQTFERFPLGNRSNY